MNHPPSQIIQQLLINGGMGLDPEAYPNSDWQIYVSSMVASQRDNAICVYDTASVKDGRLMSTGLVILHYGFQLRIRGASYVIGFKKASALFDYLSQIKKATVVLGTDSYTIHNASPGAIIPIGPDPDFKRRPLFTMNGLATLS